MSLGIICLIVTVIAFFILKKIVSFGLKAACFAVLIVAAAGTIWICSEKPDMHKPFSLDTIEYLFKINKDGSVTTTKQITRTMNGEQVK
ncbi:hypothetical protein IJ750_02950 [bacterium]|nr:hypothetical protein [bacterium]